VIRAACYPTYPSIARKVPGTRQRVGIVTYIEFDYQCEQTKSSARGMSHRSASKNSDETSNNQCSYNGQCVFRVVGGRRSVAEKYTERESSYPHYMTVLNLTNIEFLISFKDISKFERLNMVSINVYGIENKQVLLLRLTDDKKEKHVNLLYLQDSHNDNLGHFVSKTCCVS